TDEWTDEYNQGLYSDLTRAIRELTSVDDSDDTDACVQPPFDTYNQDKPLLENYRLVNFQNIRSSSSVSAGKEDALESHKLDVSWTFDLNQAALIGGSDRVTEEDVCLWTSWVPLTHCTPSCGPAYRILDRLCIVASTGRSCPTSLCGRDESQRNETCSCSPPCETIIIIPSTADRDPSIRIISYSLPNTLYFFEQTYRRIWISNKGYITFDTPYYSQTMTSFAFQQIINQAIAAPFWADLSYIPNYSHITIDWLSSTNSTGSDASTYNNVIQSVIMSACPSLFCSLNFVAARVVRITWQNLAYESSYINKSIIVSFSAYLINTYESDSSHYSYPILRSYIAFDYTNLMSDLAYLRPFVAQRDKISFYVGGRFSSQCEVSFLQETRIYILNPWENLNDIIINPRFPCPCTLRQAQVDTRFGRLFSET
ncbi:unnamed protein product, partial [Rotaria sp. Silwood2]